MGLLVASSIGEENNGLLTTEQDQGHRVGYSVVYALQSPSFGVEAEAVTTARGTHTIHLCMLNETRK